MSGVQLGCKVLTSGSTVGPDGIQSQARALEAAGFDSLWVDDHIVQPRTIDSDYPFSADGKATWSTEVPYLDALMALAVMGAVTTRVELGTAILVLPLRNPVLLAKQVASLDVMAGGRVSLGVGTGWLAEEFAALGVDFRSRGRIMDDWIALLRATWTGFPEPFESERYRLPADLVALPVPAHPLPLLIGGTSPAALRRAGRVGDGWIGQQPIDAIDVAELAGQIEALHAARPADGGAFRVLLRLAGDSALAGPDLGRLAGLGVDDVIVTPPTDLADAATTHDRLRALLAG